MSMSTESKPESAQAPQGAAHDFSVETGIYAWFRRHQKKLLYTAGLFTLLTFSVTGPMMAAVDSLFGAKQAMPTLRIGGKQVSLQPEDYRYGEVLARNPFAFQGVLPPIAGGENSQTELSDCLAMLRRVAIELGLEVSLVEVDKAIETLRAKSEVASAAQFAQQKGMASLALYRDLMREAMRVGDYIRLCTLGLDNSDARVLGTLLEDKHKITLRAATFDEKGLEDALKQKGGIDDEGLRKWLDAKPQNDKQMLQVFDSNHVALQLGALLLDGFDASQWEDEALKDFAIGEEVLKKTYEQEKATRFKGEKDGEFKPLEEDAVKAAVTKLVQAEQVMQFVLGKLRDRQNESMKSANEELSRCNDELFKAQNGVTVAKQKLDQTPDDAACKEALRLAEEVLPAKDAAKKLAETAVKDLRSKFDFKAAFAELTSTKEGAAKAGIVQKELADKRNAEALKDLDAGELGLGQFPNAVMATFLRDVGALAPQPGRTSKGVILYQLRDVELQPLKPWAQLKPLLEGAYFTEQAKNEAETKKKLLETELLRLAKGKMAERIAELEGKRKAEVDKRVSEWETKLNDNIATAQKTLNITKQGTEANRVWQSRLDALQKELLGKDEQSKTIDAAVAKETEAQIGTEAKKHYGEVMAEAAATAGFTLVEHGPFSRELQNQPRFDKAFDATVAYLWRTHGKMKVGEASDVENDKTNRRWHVAACVTETPLTAADISRREFELSRSQFGFSFADQQALTAFQQAFTKEALEQRFGFESAVGQQEAPSSPGN